MKDLVKAQILQLVGLTEEDYNVLVWERGLGYAYHYTNQDDEAVRYMTKAKSYWQWWTNQWMLIDQRFLNCYSRYRNPSAQEAIRDAWFHEHDIESMVAYPGRAVLEETFACMIGKMIDENMSQKTGGR